MLTAEDGFIEVGERCVVMENALLRGRAQHPARIGDDVLIGPHAHVNGTEIEAGCFIATGAALFPGARVGAGSEVRIHGVVQVNTVLAPGSVVPIGWIAVGDPAQILPPDRHDDIWAIQRELDFPGTVYGIPRGTDATTMMRGQSDWFAAHRDDRLSPGGGGGYVVPPAAAERRKGRPSDVELAHRRGADARKSRQPDTT